MRSALRACRACTGLRGVSWRSFLVPLFRQAAQILLDQRAVLFGILVLLALLKRPAIARGQRLVCARAGDAVLVAILVRRSLTRRGSFAGVRVLRVLLLLVV